jgi:hypothetical protein
MPRASLRDHLKRARAHVTLAEHNIDRQRDVRRTLSRDGHNTLEAEKLIRLAA